MGDQNKAWEQERRNSPAEPQPSNDKERDEPTLINDEEETE